MKFDEILLWCMFRSPKHTAKAAAEIIGISPSHFTAWRNHAKSNNYPTDDQCVKIAQLVELDPYVVWLAVQKEKVKNPIIREALKVQKPKTKKPQMEVA